MTSNDHEADTCRNYILPKLYDAGWTNDTLANKNLSLMARFLSREAPHDGANQNVQIIFCA